VLCGIEIHRGCEEDKPVSAVEHAGFVIAHAHNCPKNKQFLKWNAEIAIYILGIICLEKVTSIIFW
jgi:hypothetical protein